MVLLLTGITTAVAVWASQFAPDVEYTAEAQYIVPVQTGLEVVPSTLPGNAFDAGGLARTYATVLETDMALISALSTQSGVTLEELEEGMTASVVNSTPVVTVTFTSTDEARTLGFFPTLTNVLSQGTTPNIPPGNLVLLRSPQTTDSAGSLAPYPVLGVLAGLLLGIGAALLLERLDSRVRGAAELRRLTTHPVLDLTGHHGEAVDGVVALRALRLADDVAEVAVVGVDAPSAGMTTPLADRLARAGQQIAGHAADAPPSARWQPSGVLAGGSPAELTVQRADATVLVVAVGARMRAVEDALVQLDLLGVTSAVLTVVPRSRYRPASVETRANRSAEGDAPSTADGSTASRDLPAKP
ncbi:hypothetical protein [Cellulomonas sp. ATA003]|uniref:hypothetical protein n=1 Tax=Cellulomonas sp. ATA003 TaxID=3073064 RepID=UPI002873BCE5|nr:hypothetical protein [Cellulomonas sp. ATA003]WNB85434.1 hypothetical protein REH70_17920 [Cellulomonas sp. ATA003]